MYCRKEITMPRNRLFFILPIGALTLMLGPLAAQAEPDVAPTAFPKIEILDADYGGTGCPEGTASVVVAGNTLTILFDQYVAQTSPGYRTDRKSCNYAVSLYVPAGYTIALLKIDYRGFADIPGGALGMLTAEYFWAGSAGPIYTRYFPAYFFGLWKETNLVSGDVWSPCNAQEVIARGNTGTVARKHSSYSLPEAELSVDSLDLKAGVVYHFKWDYC